MMYLKKRGKTPKFHKRMLEQQQIRYYRELFNYLDTDKSGQLELAEIIMTLRRLQMHEAASNFMASFKAINTDHNGAVSFAEFLAIITADEVESAFGKYARKDLLKYVADKRNNIQGMKAATKAT